MRRGCRWNFARGCRGRCIERLTLPPRGGVWCVVVGLRLGCVHQARTTLRAIQTDGCGFAGWIANPVEPGMARMQDNLDILVRVLGEAPMRVLSRD